MTLYIDTKPQLEWIEYNGRHMADHYEINQTPNGRWLLMWRIGNHHYHDTLEAAKAAAQADYEARTAERFRKVELPVDIPVNFGKGSSFAEGYRTAVMHLKENIYIAKEQP
jgi:hypothetical protein